METLAEPYARCLREIEMAADIKSGSILESALEIGLSWWGSNIPSELIGRIFAGRRFSDPPAVERRLTELHAGWQREDAPAEARAVAREARGRAALPPKQRAAEDRKEAAALARVIEADKREQAKYRMVPA